MSGVKQVHFPKSTPCSLLSLNLLGINLVVILRNEKIFKTNTRKARNTRNTYGHFFYPLVFFRLRKKE